MREPARSRAHRPAIRDQNPGPGFRRPSRGFAVLAGLAVTLLLPSAQAQTSITTCPYVITAPGTYQVEANLNCTGGTDGIDIQASDVTLNLNNHVITGGGVNVGINIESGTELTNVKVNGPGYVPSFEIGLVIQNVSKSQVQKATFALNNLIGILGEFVSGLVLNADVVVQNGQYYSGPGISLFNSTNGVIQGCDTSGNQSHGIYLEAGSGNQVHNNTADANLGYGIYLSGETSDQVRNNTTNGNGYGKYGYGIYLDGGTSGNQMQSNTSLGNISGDLFDVNPGCGTDQWQGDIFFTSNQACAR